MLKCDLHLHASEDKKDPFINYSARQLIDYAAAKEFDVLSFTFHKKLFFPKDVRNYAESKGILLIPGSELMFGDKEVIVYNPPPDRFDRIKSMEDLKGLEGIAVNVPHPFYPALNCMGDDLFNYLDVIDALEFSNFYTRVFGRDFPNFNRKAVDAAREHGLTLIGSSDTHYMEQFGYTYSMIDAEKNVDSVIDAIKKGRVEVVSTPMPSLRWFMLGGKVFFWFPKGKLLRAVFRKT